MRRQSEETDSQTRKKSVLVDEATGTTGIIESVRENMESVSSTEKIEEDAVSLATRALQSGLNETFVRDHLVNAAVYIACKRNGTNVTQYELDAPRNVVDSMRPLYRTRRERLDIMLRD